MTAATTRTGVVLIVVLILEYLEKAMSPRAHVWKRHSVLTSPGIMEAVRPRIPRSNVSLSAQPRAGASWDMADGWCNGERLNMNRTSERTDGRSVAGRGKETCRIDPYVFHWRTKAIMVMKCRDVGRHGRGRRLILGEIRKGRICRLEGGDNLWPRGSR